MEQEKVVRVLQGHLLKNQYFQIIKTLIQVI